MERGRRAFGVAHGQVTKKGKLTVKCRRRAKGDFVAREGRRGERGKDERKEREGGKKRRGAVEEQRRREKEEGPSFTQEKSVTCNSRGGARLDRGRLGRSWWQKTSAAAHDRHGLRNKGQAAYLRRKNEGWTTREGMSEKDEGESKGEGRVESGAG